MYFYEIHCHTKETSRCASSTAREIVEDYKKRGFTGIVITDHFVNGNSYANSFEPWNDRIDAFVKGYNAAKVAGDELGIKVYFGLEFSCKGGAGEDYLTLGLTEDHVRNELKDCTLWEIEDFIEVVHQLGGIVIRAHPYREAEYIVNKAPERLGLNVDAIEVFNGGNAKEEFNYKAMAMAMRENKPVVAGSDTHHTSADASGYIGFEEDPQDYAALCNAIIQRKAFVVHKPKAR